MEPLRSSAPMMAGKHGTVGATIPHRDEQRLGSANRFSLQATAPLFVRESMDSIALLPAVKEVQGFYLSRVTVLSISRHGQLFRMRRFQFLQVRVLEPFRSVGAKNLMELADASE